MRIPWFWIAVFLTALFALFFRIRLHLPWLYVYLAAINLATFLLFGLDKLAAKTGITRVREAALYFFALIGGSPAALAAQSFFHHKVSKKKFVRMYWLIVLLQIAIVYVVMYTDLLKETIL
jgi:uncharacterized membrane protein YsdA (DUF1294 family)